MKFHLVFLLLFLCYDVFAQDSKTKFDSIKNDSILNGIKKVHDVQISTYPSNTPLEKVYKWRLEYIKNILETNAILGNDSFSNYVNFIMKHIIESNPRLDSMELRYFISRSPIPNASSLGDGTFIINLGLIRKINTEGQLAFILCHEIAHFYLDHSNISVIDDFTKTNSKEYREELGSISLRKYGRYELLKSMLKKNTYIEMSHSREFELEADSMGFTFFKNTNYDLHQSITCMDLLDSIDYYKFANKIDYNKTLSFSDYPFKNRWLNEENTLFSSYIKNDYWDRDSIKSHPNCDIRAGKLATLLMGNNKYPSNKFIQDSNNLIKLKRQLDIQFLESWIYYGDYGRALFLSLKNLEADTNNLSLVIMTSKILKLIHKSHINHTFSKHVDRPSNENEVEYNQFLNLLDNIRLNELENISYYFHLTYLNNLKDNEIFVKNMNYFKKTIKE